MFSFNWNFDNRGYQINFIKKRMLFIQIKSLWPLISKPWKEVAVYYRPELVGLIIYNRG